MRKIIIDHRLNLEDGTTIQATLDQRYDIRIERNGTPQYVLTVKEYIREHIQSMTEEEIHFLVCFQAFMGQYFKIKEEGNKIINELFGSNE